MQHHDAGPVGAPKDHHHGERPARWNHDGDSRPGGAASSPVGPGRANISRGASHGEEHVSSPGQREQSDVAAADHDHSQRGGARLSPRCPEPCGIAAAPELGSSRNGRWCQSTGRSPSRRRRREAWTWENESPPSWTNDRSGLTDSRPPRGPMAATTDARSAGSPTHRPLADRSRWRRTVSGGAGQPVELAAAEPRQLRNRLHRDDAEAQTRDRRRHIDHPGRVAPVVGAVGDLQLRSDPVTQVSQPASWSRRWTWPRSIRCPSPWSSRSAGRRCGLARRR